MVSYKIKSPNVIRHKASDLSSNSFIRNELPAGRDVAPTMYPGEINGFLRRLVRRNERVCCHITSTYYRPMFHHYLCCCSRRWCDSSRVMMMTTRQGIVIRKTRVYLTLQRETERHCELCSAAGTQYYITRKQVASEPCSEKNECRQACRMVGSS